MKQRIENDFYPTESALTKYLLKTVKISGSVLEPCSGQGHITQVLKEAGLKVTESDIANGAEFDATTPEFWQQQPSTDWVITNPPFSEAAQIVKNALWHSQVGIAMLLRLSFLEPTDNRGEFLRACSTNLRDLIIFNPRPRFRADTKGTDSVTVAWMVWERGFQGSTEITFANDWKVK